eukprot:2265140-Rhodomonas_salina.3
MRVARRFARRFVRRGLLFAMSVPDIAKHHTPDHTPWQYQRTHSIIRCVSTGHRIRDVCTGLIAYYDKSL